MGVRKGVCMDILRHHHTESLINKMHWKDNNVFLVLITGTHCIYQDEIPLPILLLRLQVASDYTLTKSM